MLTPADTLLERLINVPEDLVRWDQWVLWRNTEGRKLPCQPRECGRPARVNAPDTWGSFDQAVAAFAEHLAGPQPFTGIGYVFSADDPFVGVDLDDCVDGDAIHPAARDLIRQLGGYAEISPSMTGVKCWVRGALPFSGTGKRARGPWGGDLEVYHERRWFAVTGWELDQ